jgi:hypothetical protein
VIAQAAGLTAAQMGTPIDIAQALIEEHALARGQALHEVAEAIVSRRFQASSIDGAGD